MSASPGPGRVDVASAEGAMAPNVFVDRQLGDLRNDHFRAAAISRFASAFWRRAKENGARRPELVRELRVIRRVGVLVSVLVGLGLYAEGVRAPAAVLWPALTWVVLCAWVAVELGLVRHPLTGADAPHIGPANVMTLYRGWAAVPVLLIAGARPGPTLGWVALCLTAGLTDLVDGTVAIRRGEESRLGRLIDPVLDACFFSAAASSLAHWGLLPGWLAAVITLRYFTPVVGGLVLLFALGRSIPVRHTPWGQRATLATGVALLGSWLATLVRLPPVILPGLYLLAVTCMALALLGILRRTPTRGHRPMRVQFLPLLLGAYLLGSIPTGLWLGRVVAGKDVRKEGSRRSGATNVQRVLGTWAGVTVAALDVFKGTAAVLLVESVSHDPYLGAAAGVLAVVGHIWPILAGFDGGRGVSTTAGAMLALAPLPFFGAFLVMAAVVLASRYVSLGSIAAAYAIGPLAAAGLGRGPESDAVLVVAIVAGGIVAIKHADNVERLLHGRERRLGARAPT